MMCGLLNKLTSCSADEHTLIEWKGLVKRGGKKKIVPGRHGGSAVEPHTWSDGCVRQSVGTYEDEHV